MKLKLLIIIVALQAAWILGTTVVQERARAQGAAILLETRPVDPRDLLRGDYVILNYKISDIPFDRFTPPRTNAVPAGETVYVALEQRGEFHEITFASTTPIHPAPGYVMPKATSRNPWRHADAGGVHVDDGLERYYVPEGTGNPQGKLTVKAAVPASGQATIKEVFLDGKPYATAMKSQVH